MALLKPDQSYPSPNGDGAPREFCLRRDFQPDAKNGKHDALCAGLDPTSKT